MNNQGLQNPTDIYPKLPYKKQSQPWPGLASRMDPRPDHGETSYKQRLDANPLAMRHAARPSSIRSAQSRPAWVRRAS